MSNALIKLKHAPKRAPPSPIPRKRKKPQPGWRTLWPLAGLLFLLAFAMQIATVRGDVHLLSETRTESDVQIYCIATALIILSWFVEELIMEDWSGAIKSAASGCFCYCFSTSLEEMYRSTKQHGAAEWQVALFSTVTDERAATSLAILLTIGLMILLTLSFDRVGRTAIRLHFHAHHMWKEEKRKKTRAQ